MSSNRKIIIDAGAHMGQSIEQLKEKYAGEDFIIYSFEPHPRCFAWAKLHAAENVIVKNKAVWIEDGVIEFYCDSLDVNTPERRFPGEASSIFKEKTKNSLPYQFGENSKITSECFDLSSWIKKSFSKDDFIHLKMDIEGAEYEVLKKMNDDGTLDYINNLDVEFHYEDIGLSKEVHNETLQMIRKHSVLLTIHD